MSSMAPTDVPPLWAGNAMERTLSEKWRSPLPPRSALRLALLGVLEAAAPLSTPFFKLYRASRGQGTSGHGRRGAAGGGGHNELRAGREARHRGRRRRVVAHHRGCRNPRLCSCAASAGSATRAQRERRQSGGARGRGTGAGARGTAPPPRPRRWIAVPSNGPKARPEWGWGRVRGAGSGFASRFAHAPACPSCASQDAPPEAGQIVPPYESG